MKGDFTRWTFNPTKHYHGVLKQQGRVDLDADWNEQDAIAVYRTETEATDVIGPSGAPINDAGFLLSVANNKLQISKGRAYVDGILCVNEQAVAIDAQPDLPSFQMPTAAGTYVAYLTVWLRHLTPLDDAGMLEVALGGADTCTRAKTIWQVNLALATAPQGGSVDCTTPVPALQPAAAATLTAQAEPSAAAPSPCALPAQAGFRSLENQLYRVEIHNGGDVGSGNVTFKWSRDNGTVVTAWTGHNGNNLTVAGIGPDSVLGFAAGQWVELSDDVHELNFQPGILVQLTNVAGLTLTIDPSTAIPAGTIDFTKFTTNPKVRRWDSAGVVTITTALLGTWLDLENGVQVSFAAGACKTGDYWLIPARTLTGNVDWPGAAVGKPLALAPAGIRRHSCRLAIVQLAGTTWTVVGRCLPLFQPLTAISGKSIHVTGVQYFNGTAFVPLLNDSSVPLPNIEDQTWKIRVLCDAPIDSVSAKPITCFLTLEVPAAGTLDGYQPLILPAPVSVTSDATGNTIDLGLKAGTFRGLYDLLQPGPAIRLVVRLTLKGNFIWGRDDSTMYLDGAAVGITRTDADGTIHIGMILPKYCNFTTGSDFDFWFWFYRPLNVKTVTMTSTAAGATATTPVVAGQTATGTVILDGGAPPYTTVTLTTDSTAGKLSSSPTQTPAGQIVVPLAEGQTSFTFSVTSTNVLPNQTSTVLTVTATVATVPSYYAGTTPIKGTLTIVKPPS